MLGEQRRLLQRGGQLLRALGQAVDRGGLPLVMLAGAVLTIAAALEHARGSGPPGQIPLTRNEIAHLLSGMTIPAHDASHRLHWSRWRRRHQHRARTRHYQRQAAQDQET